MSSRSNPSLSDAALTHHVQLSGLEARLLEQGIHHGGQYHELAAMFLTPSEKAACQRLVKKGLMMNLMGTFFRVNDQGLRHDPRSTTTTTLAQPGA